jgi:hypothetical protein
VGATPVVEERLKTVEEPGWVAGVEEDAVFAAKLDRARR